MPSRDAQVPDHLPSWNGDVDLLIGHDKELENSEELCEQVFMSKHEAFTTGLFLASRRSADN